MRRSKRRLHHRKTKKGPIITLILFGLALFIMFVPGHNGLIKIAIKTYKKHKLQREINNLIIKSELLESKIAKGKDPTYLQKYLRDYYKMVPKDSLPE